MPPPSIIVRIIRPSILVAESEEMTIWAVCRNISSRFISILAFINSFSVYPFIKGTTVIKDTVQDNPHSSLMKFFHKFYKQRIAGFQILLIRHAFLILCSEMVFFLAFRQDFSTVFYNFSKMRIDIIIILYIVFVVGWRDKQRIEVNSFYPKIF